MATDVGAVLQGFLPNVTLSSTKTFLLYLVLVVFLVCIIIGISIWVYFTRKYNLKVVVYKRINNQFQKIGVRKAALQRVSLAGDYVLFVRGFKKTLPAPLIQMGANEYWYFIRKDGEWINFGMPDMDQETVDKWEKKQIQEGKAAGTSKVHFVDFDMRMHRLGIEKNLRDRHIKSNWFKENAVTIVATVFFILLTIMLVIIFMQWKEAQGATGEMAVQVKNMAEAVKSFYSQTFSGVQPADAVNSLRPVS